MELKPHEHLLIGKVICAAQEFPKIQTLVKVCKCGYRAILGLEFLRTEPDDLLGMTDLYQVISETKTTDERTAI